MRCSFEENFQLPLPKLQQQERENASLFHGNFYFEKTPSKILGR
jgi:hypothetical protein